jgi:hypothetical protein
MLILNKSEGQRAEATGPQWARVKGGKRSPLANLVKVAASIARCQIWEVANQHIYKLIANLIGLDQAQGAGQLSFLAYLLRHLDANFLQELSSRDFLGSTLRSALLILKHLSDAAHGVEILGLDGFHGHVRIHISNLSLLRYVQ